MFVLSCRGLFLGLAGLLLLPGVAAAQGIAPVERVVRVDELSAHDEADDCWVAVAGKVYDVTTVVPRHPGGGALVEACGSDATELFRTRPMGSGTPHSHDAKYWMENLVMGVLAGYEQQARERFHPIGADRWIAPHLGQARNYVLGAAAKTTPVGHLAFRLEHLFGIGARLPTTATGVHVGLGVSRFFDVEISHWTWTRDSGLHLRFAPLRQQDAGHPLSLVFRTGVGSRTNDVVVREDRQLGVYGSVVVGRDFLGHWLRVDGSATVVVLPKDTEHKVYGAFGAALELRPFNHFSAFAEVLIAPKPLAAGQVLWFAGLRAYTPGHSFTLAVGNTTVMSPVDAVGIPLVDGQTPRGWAIGFSFHRVFRLWRPKTVE